MRFVYALLIVLALLVAALFLVPSFLDWDQFKPEFTERLEDITGRKIEIDGPLDVSILPKPTIRAADLRVANAPGAAAPELARISSLDLSLELGPLLGGEIAVTSLEMVEPVIELQRLADGRPTWLLESGPEQETGASAAGEAQATGGGLIRIDAVTVTNGTIIYRHGEGEPPERVERISAALTARSLGGPFRGEGELAVRGRAIRFLFATGTVGEDRTVPASLEATIGDEQGTALFEGILRGLDGIPTFDGSVRADAADLAALLNALAVDLGSMPAPPLASEFSVKGALSLSTDAIAASELQVRLGESQVTGALSWEDGDVPLLSAEIDLNRIDLDSFLPVAGEPEPARAAAGSTGGGQPGDTAAPSPLQTIPADIRHVIPTGIDANVDLTIDALTWREGVIRQATARLTLEDGVVKIRPVSALLPGGAKVDLVGRLAANGEDPWMVGVAEIAAEDLRAILSWLGEDVGVVPADRLRRLSASVDFSASGDRISASNIDLRVDTTRIAGNAGVTTGERPQIAADLAIDAVNVDAYLTPAGAAPTGETVTASTGEAGDADEKSQEGAPPTPDGAGDDPWARLDEIDADVALTVDALTYGGTRLAGLKLDAALEADDLTVRRASVADVAGTSVSITGVTRTLATEPRFDLAVEGAADSLEGVVALLDIDPDIRTEAFGKVTLNGTVEGGRDALSLDLALAAGASEVTLAGTVDRPFDEQAAALALRVHAPDAASLARTAGLTPPAVVTRLGALAIDGGIGGDFDSVALNLFAETAGATLQLAGKVTDPFATPGYSVDVELSHPQGEALVETLAGGVPKDAALGALRLAGTVSGDRTATDFANIDAAMGDSTLTGGVSLRLDQEPPTFSAELQGGVLDLAWLAGGLSAPSEAEDDVLRLTSDGLADTGIEGAAPQPARWSDEPVDLAVLDQLSGTLALGAEALVFDTYRIDQATVDLKAADGLLTLRSLAGRLFDGALIADGSLTGGETPAGQAAFRLADADLGAILRAAAGVDAVSGTAEADGYFTLRGQTEREIVQSLAGRVALTSREGAIEGVDVPAISRQIDALSKIDALDDIASFVEGTERSLSSGQTAIRSVDGTVRVQDGLARMDGFEIVADGSVGDISGTADLPAWQLDLTALFRLTDHADAPPVGIHFDGPIDRPERRYLIEKMQAHLVKIGLLSLAGASDMPKITLRKGAKAEPGTEMDTLLRDVLGDPDEAEDTGRAEAGETLEEADESGGKTAADEADGAGSAALSPDDGSDDAASAEEPSDAGQAQEPAGVDQTDVDDEPLETGGEEMRAAEPTTEEAAGKGPVPQPPPSPKHARDEDLQDLVDDLLKSLE